MIAGYDEKVEQAISARIHEHEATKQAAERTLINTRNIIAKEEQTITHLQFTLNEYRTSYGLPSQPNKPSPVLEKEYSHRGPTELVEYWADNHGGDVIVKDLTRVAMKAGVFTNYRGASASIYAVLKRKPFQKVSPGHFQRIEITSGDE